MNAEHTEHLSELRVGALLATEETEALAIRGEIFAARKTMERQQEASQHPPLRPVASGRRVLIVGCGSLAAGDDSAGLEIVRRLSELGDCGCALRTETAPGLGLLDAFSLADVILFVDAVTSGGVPGTLYLTSLPSKELEPRALGSLSNHGWGLAEALKLAHALGRTIHGLFLLGIEAGTVTQGAPRSPAVEQAVNLVVERIAQLKSLLLSDGLSGIIGIRSFCPNDRSFPGNAGLGFLALSH